MKKISLSKKKKLESALKRSLKLALVEMKSVNKGFSEESLRYIVMSELSKKEIWGSFPNPIENETKLLFQQEYNILKFKKRIFKPDIISKNEEQHLLAIELKIKNDITDVDKCKEYISESKGWVSFDLAASVYAIMPGSGQIDYKVKDKIKHAEKIGKNIHNSRLLVAFIEWERDATGRNGHINSRIRLEWIY